MPVPTAASGTGDGYCWADELFVSIREKAAAQGFLTGRRPGRTQLSSRLYAAFVLDPDGNNIEAVYHGEARRSAAAVRITIG
jgi:hypothetical protein